LPALQWRLELTMSRTLFQALHSLMFFAIILLQSERGLSPGCRLQPQPFRAAGYSGYSMDLRRG
jgi:hypothetical protein